MDYLDEVRKRLDISPAEKEQAMKELEDHYSELRNELQTDGMNECEAATEAARRLGDPKEIASEIQTAHWQVGWKTVLITIAPIFMAAIPFLLGRATYSSSHPALKVTVLLLSVQIAFFMFLLFPCIKEFKAGRRPIWLATWFPMSLSSLQNAMFTLFTGSARLHHNFSAMNLTGSILGAIIWCSAAIFLVKLRQGWTFRAAMILGLGIIVQCIAALGLHDKFSPPLLPIIGIAIFSWTLSILIAVEAFCLHPLGNAAACMLFIFTRSNVNIVSGNPYRDAVYFLFQMLIVALFLRQSTLRNKILYMLGGMVAYGILPLIGSGHTAFLSTYTPLRIAITIGIPLIFSFKYSNIKPQVAA